MICPECGGYVVRNSHELYCSCCGLVVDDVAMSFEFPSRFNYPFKNGSTMNPNMDRRVQLALDVLKLIGNGLPKNVILRAEYILKKAIKSELVEKISYEKICKAAICLSLKERGIEVEGFRNEKYLKLLELIMNKRKESPYDKINLAVNRLLSNLGLKTGPEEHEKVLRYAEKLHGKGCNPKNAAATAIYFVLMKNNMSIRKFARLCGVSPSTLHRLLNKISSE